MTEISPIDPRDMPAEETPDDMEKKSAATRLVEMAQELYRFGVSTDSETYAVPRSGPKVVATLHGNRPSIRSQLADVYFQRHGRVAPQQALTDALLVIEGMARKSEPAELHLRVAHVHGVHYLDIGDHAGQAVEITTEGWRIVGEPPVLFKRTALNGPLPQPDRGGSLHDLWHLLNISEADRPLVAAWLVSTLYTGMSHPVLSLFGEQGTGKTTAQRMLVRLVDPGPVPTRKPPRDAESWVTAAAGSWFVGLDNLSSVPDWLSDSICRAVTGESDVRRKLYTDGEYAIFTYRRCVLLNGIDLGAMRGDLAERMLPVHLDLISERERVGDQEICAQWEKAWPQLLGAVLDLAAGVAGVLPSVRLESKPRMADFARIVAAVDEILGTNGLDHHLTKQNALATDTLTADPFMATLISTLTKGFEGTAAELLERITPERLPKGWPGSARAVTQRLHRHAPALRRFRWHVSDDGGRNRTKALRWTLRPEIARNGHPQHPQAPERRGLEDPHAAGYANATPAREGPQTRAIEQSAGVAGVDDGPSLDGDAEEAEDVETQEL